MIASMDSLIFMPSTFNWPITFTLQNVDADFQGTEVYSQQPEDFEVTFRADHALVGDKDGLLSLPHYISCSSQYST